MGVIPTIQLTDAEKFDNAYWLSKPPSHRPLRDMDGNSGERYALAFALAANGQTIDFEIDAMGLSGAYGVMSNRERHGTPWYPAIGEKMPSAAAGLWWPDGGWPSEPPKRHTKTSTRLEDYPPFDPPVVVVPVAAVPFEPDWRQTVGGTPFQPWYAVRDGDKSEIGYRFEGGVQGVWEKRAEMSPFGGGGFSNVRWERVVPVEVK